MSKCPTSGGGESKPGKSAEEAQAWDASLAETRPGGRYCPTQGLGRNTADEPDADLARHSGSDVTPRTSQMQILSGHKRVKVASSWCQSGVKVDSNMGTGART